MPVIKCFNRKCKKFDEGAVDHCGAVLVSIQNCPNGIIRKDKPPVNDYARALASNECACGKDKKPGYAFCYGDYAALPDKMKRALWKRIGQGFEEAYEAAIKWLEENVW
jgi:hypothetical protein